MTKLVLHNFLILFITLAIWCPPGPYNIFTYKKKAGAKAFPGAMGFGTDTPGGRGGKVMYVTSLKDSGPGSLRAALEASGPRMVLFKVSGTINLKSNITITSPYLTVAGQTAPGEGVQIRGGHVRIATNDVIIRYLKVRSGDEGEKIPNADRDSITVNSERAAYNIVIDHCTLIWGPDIGGLSFLNDARDVTVSYSIMGEGLYLSGHPEATIEEGGHSMAMNITELSSARHPKRITVHHNLLTTSADRNPRIIGGANIDIVNNVIYNWQQGPSQGNPRSVNLIKNYYIRGPMTTDSEFFFAWQPRTENGGSLRRKSVYESGNLVEGFTSVRGDPQSVYASEPFTPYSITVEDSPKTAYDKITKEVGASLQVASKDGRFATLRDSVDKRIISNLINREGEFLNGRNITTKNGYEEISWPELSGGPAALDKDLDGMPDAWEIRFFGNTKRGSPDDSSGDLDGDGYTDLEEYLNRTNPTR